MNKVFIHKKSKKKKNCIVFQKAEKLEKYKRGKKLHNKECRLKYLIKKSLDECFLVDQVVESHGFKMCGNILKVENYSNIAGKHQICGFRVVRSDL